MTSMPIKIDAVMSAFVPAPPLLAESPAGDTIPAGEEPGSIAPPEQKLSNTDPESDVPGSRDPRLSGKHSDRLFIDQNYGFPIPTGGGKNPSSSTVQNNTAPADVNEIATKEAERVKEQLGSNISIQQTSKSMIIYNSSLGRAKFMRTPRAATRRARKAGISCVFIEAIWQGPPEGDIDDPQQRTYEFIRLRDFARAFSKQGITVFLWGRANKGMEKDFCNHIFMVAKRVGAVGVVVNPEVSYATSADGSIIAARLLSKMVKQKAKEFNLLSGVYLPWFSKFMDIDGDKFRPYELQINFPYSEF